MSDIRYKEYLNDPKFENATDYSGKDIVLKPSDAISIDLKDGATKEDPVYKDTPLVNKEGKEYKVIAWSDDYSGFTWEIDIPQSGFYNISMEYFYDDDDDLGINAIRELAINGKVPFSEASELVFKKWWVDEVTDGMINKETGEIYPERTNVDDDIIPALTHVSKWTTAYLRDTKGYYAEPFRFYFEAGKNTITLYCSSKQMYLGNIIFSQPENYKNYQEYAGQFTSDGKDASEWSNLIEAEDIRNIVLKSSNQMRLTSSKDTSVYPNRSGYTTINQIGGETNWYENRDSYEWKFTVPKDGWYKISLRVSNNVNIGMPVYRQIYIDGEIPFEEFLAYKFKFGYNYYTKTLEDNEGNPYSLYLKEGEHTLKMEVVMGELGDVALTFYQQANDLNLMIRQIQKIIGDNPDKDYNYRLDQRIPGLADTLNGLITSFEQIIEQLKVACETDSSSIINDLKGAIDTLHALSRRF